MIKPFLSGAITLAAIVVAMFFWRFMQQTRDRFFGFFALAFLLIAAENIHWLFFPEGGHSSVFLVRLAAFLVIIFAIIDKNRTGAGSA